MTVSALEATVALYEFHCEACEHDFTVSETISEHEKKKRTPKCPECGSTRTRQRFSGFYAKTASKT